MASSRREQVLNAAIAAGKFPESRRATYAAMYDRNPAYTEQVLATLAAGVAPPAAATGPAPHPMPHTASLFPELRYARRPGPASRRRLAVPAEPPAVAAAVPEPVPAQA